MRLEFLASPLKANARLEPSNDILEMAGAAAGTRRVDLLGKPKLGRVDFAGRESESGGHHTQDSDGKAIDFRGSRRILRSLPNARFQRPSEMTIVGAMPGRSSSGVIHRPSCGVTPSAGIRPPVIFAAVTRTGSELPDRFTPLRNRRRVTPTISSTAAGPAIRV